MKLERGLVRAPALRTNELRKAHVFQGGDPQGTLTIWIMSRLCIDLRLFGQFLQLFGGLSWLIIVHAPQRTMGT